MLGRIQCRNTRNKTEKFSYSKNSRKSASSVPNNSVKHENFMKKTNSRRRRQEISSIKRGQRHLLIDSETRPEQITKKKKKREMENVKVKKKKKNCNGRCRGSSLTSCRDETKKIICNKTEENFDNDMSDHSSGGQMPIKKRGHQHHPRFAGQRRSNVPAEEVLAALRRGGIMEVSRVATARTADILEDTPLSLQQQQDQMQIMEGQQTNDTSGRSELHDFSEVATMTSALQNDDVITAESQEDLNRNMIGCDTHIVHDEENNSIPENTTPSALPNVVLNLESCNTSLPSSCSITPSDESKSSVLDETKLKSPKPGKRDRSKSSPKSEEKRKKKQQQRQQEQYQRESQSQNEFPKQERSAGDGAPADDSADFENDPEAEEWARLRCTSERAEVIAEREIRRHKARCSDYPGLAFGRSIFSSDTMMKFNIIRNELHNIMKTQLKRVKFCYGLRNLKFFTVFRVLIATRNEW